MDRLLRDLAKIIIGLKGVAQLRPNLIVNAMNRALLSGGGCRIGSGSTILPLLYPSLQPFRNASLLSAIGKGIRKSKGVGFRGKERSQPRKDVFDGELKSRPAGIVRRTADPPVVSSITRDGARLPFRHERRAAARASSDASGVAMRLRMGKRDVKDDRDPPPRRSRAARFNDPSHSFGKKSQERRQETRYPADEDIDHDIEDVRARLQVNDGRLKGGRRRPAISTANLGAAESGPGRIAPDRNPDGSKLSKSRLAFLEKTANGPPSPGDRLSRPPRESYQFIPRDGDSDRSPRYDRPTRDAREPQTVDRPRTQFQFNRPARESRDNSIHGTRLTETNKQTLEVHDNGAPLVRPAFTQTLDNRYPISIDYTTPASEFLYGTSVVEAALLSRRSPRRKLYKLYIYAGENRENAERDAAMERLAKKNKVSVVRVDGNNARLMDKMSGGRPHNGYVLESSPLPRLPVTSLGMLTGVGAKEGFSVVIDHQSREEAAVNGTDNFISTGNAHGRKPFVLYLDSIVDPGNLGGILRTASFLGVTAIAISTRNSASFTPVVLKASAGASENITLFSVNKPAGFIQDSKDAGWKVYASVAPSGKSASSTTPSTTTDELDNPLLDEPCILMLGNEGEGLRWNLRSKADVELAIRGSSNTGGVDSLNVSVATGILCNAFLRRAQRSNRHGKLVDESSFSHENIVEKDVSKEKLF